MVDLKAERTLSLPVQLARLGDLATNLVWSWHPADRMLFNESGRQAWKGSGHNPTRMLRDLPKGVLISAENDQQYLRHHQFVLSRFNEAMRTQEGWFKDIIKDLGSLPNAYFSAEYGLDRSLPFYASGLGFLARDHLKECRDLAAPLVTLGFMDQGKKNR